MEPGQRIRKARLSANPKITQQQLATACGISRAAVSQWENGNTINLKGENLVKAASQLNVREEWITHGIEPMRAVDLNISSLKHTHSAGLVSVTISARQIPILDYVQAGHPKEVMNEGNDFEPIGIDERLAQELGPYAFGLIVEGMSMAPEILPGDIVVIDPDVEPTPGDVVVAELDGESKACLKKYRPRGNDENGYPIIELVPYNDDYPTITISAKNPGRIIGTVMERRLKRRK